MKEDFGSIFEPDTDISMLEDEMSGLFAAANKWDVESDIIQKDKKTKEKIVKYSRQGVEKVQKGAEMNALKSYIAKVEGASSPDTKLLGLINDIIEQRQGKQRNKDRFDKDTKDAVKKHIERISDEGIKSGLLKLYIDIPGVRE